MSKRNRVKNPCRICNQTVAHKSGVQCKGACARWAHYKCLGYTHQKMLDIRDGVIKITCPCPNCSPKVPVEVTEGQVIREFFPGRLGDARCPLDGPCKSLTKQSPGQLPGQSPPLSITPSSKPIPEQNACAVAGKMSPCILEVPPEPTPNTMPARQLPPRKQYLSQPFIRKQTDCQNIHGKPPCLKPGQVEAPCQPVEEASIFPRSSPKRSFIKPKDEFAFNPTSLDPQLFHPAAFKSKPMPPPEKLISRTPSPICQPIPEKGMTPPGEPVIKSDKDGEIPPLSKTPSKISLVSPKEEKSPSGSASQEKSPSDPTSPQKTPSASSQKSPSGSPRTTPKTSKTIGLPDIDLLSKLPEINIKDRIYNFIYPPTSFDKYTQTYNDNYIVETCTSISNNLLSTLSKNPSKAPPPALKSAPPKSGVTSSENKICMDCTSSTFPQNNNTTQMPGEKPYVDCTSSICSNRYPSLRSAKTSTDKKSRSCGCLTVFRESEIRTAISDSKVTNDGQSMLFSAIDRLCTTVGQLSGQLKQLMSRMRVNS